MKDVPVVCMQTRFSSSEKYTSTASTMPIQILKQLGVKVVILTGLCETMTRSSDIGEILIIKDHFSLPLSNLDNPLKGLKDANKLAVNKINSKELRNLFKEIGRNNGMYFNDCVYGATGGPSSETIAISK